MRGEVLTHSSEGEQARRRSNHIKIGFGELAGQLRDVRAAIHEQSERKRLADAAGNPQESKLAGEIIGHLVDEEQELESLMLSHVQPIETSTDASASQDGLSEQSESLEKSGTDWRLQGASREAITRELVSAPDYAAARDQLARENPELNQHAIHLVLSEVVPLIQEGRLPVTDTFWRDQVLSKPVSNEKPESRWLDKDDWDPDEESERGEHPQEAGVSKEARKKRELSARLRAQGLPTRSVSSYDTVNDMRALDTEPMGEPIPQTGPSHAEKLAENLRRAAGLDTGSQDAYLPPSPLNEAARDPETRSEPHGYNEKATDFARRLHEVEEARRNQAAEQIRASNADNFDANRETLAPGEFWIGSIIFRPGERVLYTERDGDKGEHVVLGPSEDNPPGLRLRNPETGTTFAISQEAVMDRIEKVGENTQPPDDTERPRGPKPPEDGEVETPTVEVPDELKEQIPQVPTFADLMADAEVLRDGLDGQIKNIAAAKKSREKLFGTHFKDREAKLKSEQGKLDQLHGEYMDAWAYRLAMVEDMDKEFDGARDGFLSEIDARRERIAGIRVSNDSEDTKVSKISALETEIKQYEAAIAETEKRRAETKESIKDLRDKATQNMIVDLATVRTRVEEAQTELKGGKGLARFKQLWKSKGGIAVRIAAGAGLVGLSLTGPIGAAVGVAGLAAMRGVGGYYGGEATWNAGHRFREGRRGRRDERTASSELTEEQRAALGSDIEAIGTGIESTPENDGRQDRSDTEAFLRRNPMARAEVERVMRGEAEASAAIAVQLMKDQRERIQRDAKSNRSAKIAGAVVGSTLAVAGLWRSLGIHRPPTDGPKPYQPDVDRLRGIVTSRPEAPQQWVNMMANAPKGSTAAEAAFNQVYEQAARGLSRSQLTNLNRVIGRLSTIDGYGNDWTQQNMSYLVRQVKNGFNADEIIDKFNSIGGPNVGPANL